MVATHEKFELAAKIIKAQGGLPEAVQLKHLVEGYSREELRRMYRAAKKRPETKQPRDPKTQRWGRKTGTR